MQPVIEDLPSMLPEEEPNLDLANPQDAQDFINACTIMMNRTALDEGKKHQYIRDISSNMVRIMRSDDRIIKKVSEKISVLLKRANNLPHQIEEESLPGIIGQIIGTLTSA